MDLQALVLDFDGVIVESEHLKLAAFAALFAGEAPEHQEAIRRYYWENSGLPRGTKLQHVFSAILQRPADPAYQAELARRFEAAIAEEYRRCPMVPGALELLEAFVARCPLFLVSGTPEEHLQEMAQAHGVAHYFTGIFGSPPGKGELITHILRHWRLNARRVVMVGDSRADIEGAREARVHFIGRIRPDGETFAGWGVPTVRDLHELKALLNHWPTAASSMIGPIPSAASSAS